MAEHLSSRRVATRVCARLHLWWLITAVLLVGAPRLAHAADITVAWDRNAESSVAGYVVYVSTQADTLGQALDAGTATFFVHRDVTPDTTYYFYVAAYERTDGGMVVGQLSAAVSTRTPAAVPLPTTGSTSLLSNGGFESGITGWTAAGNQGVVSAGSWWGMSEGTRAVAFNSGDSIPNGAVSRVVPTVVGRTYTLSFDVGALSRVNRDEQRLLLTVQGGTTLVSKTIAVLAPGNGTQYTPQAVTFVANSTATAITFRDTSTRTVAVDLLLDNVQVR